MWLIYVGFFALILTTYVLLYTGEDEKKVKICLTFLLIILWFEILFMSISLGQLKLTEYNNVSPSITVTIDNLLDCAVQQVPRLNKSWGLVKDCAHVIKVYHVPKAKVPIVQNIPVAFVTPKIFSDDVFVVNPQYDILSNTSKALVIIHECTHLVLGTVDHAYLWQSNFNTLTSVKHLENADSYVDIILNNCINDIYVF